MIFYKMFADKVKQLMLKNVIIGYKDKKTRNFNVFNHL